MSEAAARWVVSGFDGSQLDAVKAALADCGLVVLDEAPPRAMLVAGGDDAIAKAVAKLPYLRFAPEKTYRIADDD